MKPYYSDSLATIYHADCREILPTLADSSVDMILTDPPYGHNNNDNDDLISRREHVFGHVKSGKSAAGLPRPIANDGPEASDLVRWLFAEASRLLMPGCCCCCCCCGGGPEPQFARWAFWMDELIGFKQAIVWDKGGLGMGWHYRRNYEMVLVGEKPGAACRWYGGNRVGNVIRINGIRPSKEDHPTPKPVALFQLFLSFHSLPGHLVLDPFLGGGTTLAAAKQMGRRAIGCEVEEKWCEMAAKRLAQEYLPLEPVKLPVQPDFLNP